MNIAEIKYYDSANGDGVRTSVFVSGCRRHCKGCFNEVAWDFDYGREFDADVVKEILDSMREDYIQGLSILGGEPLEPENRKDVLALISCVRHFLPKKDIWLFTGYTFMELYRLMVEDDIVKNIIEEIDVVKTGPFIEDLKDISLQFRGSSNQEILRL